MRRRLPAVILLLSIAALSQDRNPNVQSPSQWGSLTIFNGMPSDDVRAIAQTPDGIMWFGTDNGIARFDGRRIQIHRFERSESNRVLTLRTDPAGSLWVGTDSGAFVMTAGVFREIRNLERIPVTAILVADTVLVATDGGKFFNVSSSDGVFSAAPIGTVEQKSAGNDVLRITALSRIGADLAAGTNGDGLLLFDGLLRRRPIRAKGPKYVNAIRADKNGAVWIAGGDQRRGRNLYRLDGSSPNLCCDVVGDILALEAGPAGGIWVGTGRNGLFRVDSGGRSEHFTFANTSGSLRSDTINSIFADREGVLWIGTDRGISRFDRAAPFHRPVSDIPNSNFVRTFYRKSDGRLFAGTNKGLFELDGSGWNRVQSFGLSAIYAIAETPEKSLIAATPDGIAGLPVKSGDIRSISMYRGVLFAADFGRGILRIEGDSVTNILSDTSVTASAVIDRELWIGSIKQGILNYDGVRVRQLFAAETLAIGAVWKISGSPDGSVWIAGEKGLISVKDNEVQRVIEGFDVRDIVVDERGIWAATSASGLIHIRRDPDLGALSATIGADQGLPSDKTFAILKDGDRLIVGTNRGVISYLPNTVAPGLIPVRILSSRLHDLGEIGEVIPLEFPQDSLLIEVAGQSSRTFAEEFQYYFLLRNSAGDVLDRKLLARPEYAPANLPPGGYVIEARAINRDLLISEPLFVSFKVAKAPFPWTATALGGLLLLALGGLVWAFIEHRRMRERNRELAEARFNLTNEAERERRRIARDLHDQTLADLRSLMLASDRIAPRDPEFRAEVEAVSAEIRRICEDLSPSALENVGLVAALEFLLKRTFDDGNFIGDEELEEKPELAYPVQLQIYRVVQEVLTNIKIHSDARSVTLSVRISREGLSLAIDDDGQPFSPDESTTLGRGIANIRARASLINAAVDWRVSTDKGNRFTLLLRR